jgi:hypothetical protein
MGSHKDVGENEARKQRPGKQGCKGSSFQARYQAVAFATRKKRYRQYDQGQEDVASTRRTRKLAVHALAPRAFTSTGCNQTGLLLGLSHNLYAWSWYSRLGRYRWEKISKQTQCLHWSANQFFPPYTASVVICALISKIATDLCMGQIGIP